MIFLSDFKDIANFGRTLGAKDKKKRKLRNLALGAAGTVAAAGVLAVGAKKGLNLLGKRAQGLEQANQYLMRSKAVAQNAAQRTGSLTDDVARTNSKYAERVKNLAENKALQAEDAWAGARPRRTKPVGIDSDFDIPNAPLALPSAGARAGGKRAANSERVARRRLLLEKESAQLKNSSNRLRRESKDLKQARTFVRNTKSGSSSERRGKLANVLQVARVNTRRASNNLQASKSALNNKIALLKQQGLYSSRLNLVTFARTQGAKDKRKRKTSGMSAKNQALIDQYGAKNFEKRGALLVAKVKPKEYIKSPVSDIASPSTNFIVRLRYGYNPKTKHTILLKKPEIITKSKYKS